MNRDLQGRLAGRLRSWPGTRQFTLDSLLVAAAMIEAAEADGVDLDRVEDEAEIRARADRAAAAVAGLRADARKGAEG